MALADLNADAYGVPNERARQVVGSAVLWNLLCKQAAVLRRLWLTRRVALGVCCRNFHSRASSDGQRVVR